MICLFDANGKSEPNIFSQIVVSLMVIYHGKKMFKKKTLKKNKAKINTLPETNAAPENWCLEDELPFEIAHFQGRTVSFREGNH